MKRLTLLTVLIIMSYTTQAAAKGPDSTDKATLLLKRADNKMVNTADYKGKILFINFWAMSCVPCLEEMPDINRLAMHFNGATDLVILPVDMDGELAKSSSYMADHHYNLAVYNIESVVPATWFHGVLPTTAVIDKNGDLIYYHEGKEDYDSANFITFIDKLLAK